jgi:hypothetical protein
MDITTQPFTVEDFHGTSLEDTFRAFPADRLVIQAHDADTGLVCALVAAEYQPADDLEREACYQLAVHIHEHARGAGDATDPRYEL